MVPGPLVRDFEIGAPTWMSPVVGTYPGSVTMLDPLSVRGHWSLMVSAPFIHTYINTYKHTYVHTYIHMETYIVLGVQYMYYICIISLLHCLSIDIKHVQLP